MDTVTSQTVRVSRARPAALRADHDHQRRGGQLEGVGVGGAVGVQPGDHQPLGGVVLQRADQVGAAGHPDPGRGTRRRAPGRRRHPGAAPLRHHDAVRAERRRRPDDRAEVARVGDAVDRDDQRAPGRNPWPWPAGPPGARTGTAARPGPGPDGWRCRSAGPAPAGTPPAARCPARRPPATASVTRSSEASPAGDVQRGRRHPGPQRLDHRVAPDHRLRQLAPCPAPGGRGAAGPALPSRLAAAAARRAAGWPLRASAGGVGPRPCTRAPGLPARADDGALLGARLAHRAPPLGIAGHHCLRPSMPELRTPTPRRPSASVPGPGTAGAGRRPTRPGRPWCPRWRIRPPPAASRIASALAKSRAARAVVRSTSSASISVPGRLDQPPVLAAGRPRRRPRVEAQHGDHRPHRRGDLRRGRVVARRQRGVSGPHPLVDDGQRPRHPEVVVHRLPEGVRHRADRHRAAGRPDRPPGAGTTRSARRPSTRRPAPPREYSIDDR